MSAFLLQSLRFLKLSRRHARLWALCRQLPRAARHLAAALLFAPACPLCDRPGTGILPELCSRCRDGGRDILTLHPQRQGAGSDTPRCSRCAALLAGAGCDFCDGRQVFFARHRAIWPLTAVRRELLHRWKFENERQLWRLFHAGLIYPEVLTELQAARFDCVTWIDSGPAARRLRNYQPCADLARSLARALGCPGLALLRKRRRRTQSAGSLPERFFGMHDSLQCVPGRPVPARVLILEDVYTTGATANEAARMLKKNGAFHVEIVSLFIRDAAGGLGNEQVKCISSEYGAGNERTTGISRDP